MNHDKIITPWGIAQSVEKVIDGIYFYETAGHGGYKIDAYHNELIPKEYRAEGGWYDEDNGAVIVEYFLFEVVQYYIPMGHFKDAVKAQFEEYFGVKINEDTIPEKMNRLERILKADINDCYDAMELSSYESPLHELNRYRKKYLANNFDDWEFEKFWRKAVMFCGCSFLTLE